MEINRNKSLKWLIKQDRIFVDERMKDYKNPVRGIYGIFVEDESKICVYVGRTDNMYRRMFKEKGHIEKLSKGIHENEALVNAIQNEKKIVIEILEDVPYEFDNYYKDMQRLASAESKWIDFYQEKDQCLQQVPEGKWIDDEEWKRIGNFIKKSDARIDCARDIYSQLIYSEVFSFLSIKPSDLPGKAGVYIIWLRDTGEVLYVGRTRNIRQRIYTNQLMGNQSSARLKKYLVDDARHPEITNISDAKDYIKTNCNFQYILIEDNNDRGHIEGLIGYLTDARYIESEH